MFKEQLYLDALRLYAGKHVADRVTELGRAALGLGSEPRHLTAMYIDIRIEPEAMQNLPAGQFWANYKTHQQGVVDSIQKRGGLIDSMSGDAYIALFGVDGIGNHAVLALSCASDLVHLSNRSKTGITGVVGVNTGQMHLGNFGTPERIKFTVMGDVLNLASRLCDRCHEYSVQVLIGGATLEYAGDAAAPARAVDSIRIKGKEDVIDIFTLADVRKT